MMGICYLFEVAGVLCKPCLDMRCRLSNSHFAGPAASAEMCALGGGGRGRVCVALKVCTVVCPFGWSHSGFGGP